MKVTINIDCTPLEARQFFGLPDVEPMQKAVMGEMEAKMMAEIKDFSTEKLMTSWLSFAPQNADWLRGMMGQFANMTMGGGKTDAKP